jgi:Icc-related predicted phosphoesterase
VIAGDFSETYFKHHWEFHVPKTSVMFYQSTMPFLSSIKKPIVIVAGNHDYLFDSGKLSEYRLYEAELKTIPGLHYLNCNSVEIDGVTFWGNPWTPAFYNWAFNYPMQPDMYKYESERRWMSCPDEVNVIVSHGPPLGILDGTVSGESVGCGTFSRMLPVFKQLRACVFGHIHNGYGLVSRDGVQFVNASVCTEDYNPTNLPILIDI